MIRLSHDDETKGEGVIDERRSFMLKAQLSRTRWARKTDPEGYAMFEIRAKKRRGNGKRKARAS